MDLETLILQPNQLDQAVVLLQQGEIVAFPTETVYGLGANALDGTAVSKIFAAKDRPGDNPLIIHIHDYSQVESLVKKLPRAARELMDKFWPGPLSLVLPKSETVVKEVSAGLDTVALRMPDHPIALELLKHGGLPLAAPSANTSGKPSPTRASHVYHDLKGKIPAIIDGGATGWGVESTVLDCSSWPFRILRPGGVTLEQLRELMPIEVDPGIYQQNNDQPRSPGMKYQHYAPDATVVLVVGDQITMKINQLADSPENANLKIGVLATTESKDAYPGLTVLDLGSRLNQKMIASRIYHLLRVADQLDLDLVFVEGFSEAKMGMAIMNRLRRAANYQILET